MATQSTTISSATLDCDRAAVRHLRGIAYEHAAALLLHGRIGPAAADAQRAHADDCAARLDQRLRELRQRRHAMAAIEQAQTERIGASR